jgi:hypothetical protein
MMFLISQASQLPTTEIGLFGLVIVGLIAMVVKNAQATDRHLTRLVESSEVNLKNVVDNHSADLAKVMKTHEQVSTKIVTGLDGVKDSVSGLGRQIDKHGEKIKTLIAHVKGPMNDDDSN